MKPCKLARLGLVLGAGMLLSACPGDESSTTTPDIQTVITVDVTPDGFTLQIGQTRQLAAVVTGSANQAVTWSTSAATVATVSTGGLVTAHAMGTAVITAVSAADAAARDASVVQVPGRDALVIQSDHDGQAIPGPGPKTALRTSN